MMKKNTLALLILTFLSFAAAAQTESKCFKNEGLQGRSVVNFETEGAALTGTYSVEISGEPESSKTYEFKGNRKGKFLTVLFDQDVLPDVAPSFIKSVNWTLEKKGDEEVLGITFYGKNYETNKYANYEAEFEPCEPSYAKLLKTAKIVRFAKGKTSAVVPLAFADTSEQKVFLLNVRRGQTLDIDAASCAISVYLPNKERYQIIESEDNATGEKFYTPTTIDGMLVEPILQTGNYLVVLRKLSEDSSVTSATFKITN